MSGRSLSVRLVAFLFMNSACFTSLVQSIYNRSSDLVGFCYAEQGNNHVSSSQYLNTNTSNVVNYNTSYIPSQITYKRMHKRAYNLTSAVWLQSFNSFHVNRLRGFNVTVVCLCVDCSISKDVHLFLSCIIWRKETLDSVSVGEIFSPDVFPFIELSEHRALSGSLYNLSWQHYISLRSNRQPIFISGISVEYLAPTVSRGRYGDLLSAVLLKDDSDEIYSSLKTCSEQGLSHRAIVGIIVGITLGVLAVVMSHARCLYNGVFRKKKAELVDLSSLSNLAPNGSTIRGSESSGAVAARLAGITIDKATEFSYEELSKATNGFSIANKIGQGGFGVVYYAVLRGQKAAIKKMDMQASKEFLAELNVLTHVHHLNLVHLIGYCAEGSHFLVYEFIENGNLSQHIHGSGRDPLPWSARVQIALDSARGLEYIHEYTVSVFIHCDIKSANILIDKNFHGKVADFGLTRLTEVGSRSRLMGTFGYMSPEYAQYGDVSPKVDVYAFGVVLYELISAKKAIIRENGSDGEPKGLIALFNQVLSQAAPEDDLVKMIDPRLGDNYPLDSVYKMAQLAKACTHEDPQRRPHMRSVVVALTNLSSSMYD